MKSYERGPTFRIVHSKHPRFGVRCSFFSGKLFPFAKAINVRSRLPCMTVVDLLTCSPDLFFSLLWCVCCACACVGACAGACACVCFYGGCQWCCMEHDGVSVFGSPKIPFFAHCRDFPHHTLFPFSRSLHSFDSKHLELCSLLKYVEDPGFWFTLLSPTFPPKKSPKRWFEERQDSHGRKQNKMAIFFAPSPTLSLFLSRHVLVQCVLWGGGFDPHDFEKEKGGRCWWDEHFACAE